MEKLHGVASTGGIVHVHVCRGSTRVQRTTLSLCVSQDEAGEFDVNLTRFAESIEEITSLPDRNHRSLPWRMSFVFLSFLARSLSLSLSLVFSFDSYLYLFLLLPSSRIDRRLRDDFFPSPQKYILAKSGKFRATVCTYINNIR